MRLFLIPASISLLLLAICRGEPKIGGNLLNAYAYNDSAQTLKLWRFASHCEDDDLVQDTMAYSATYAISGDTLTENVPYNLAHDGQIRAATTLMRDGSGAGLQGAWKVKSVEFFILSGSEGGSVLDSVDRANGDFDTALKADEGVEELVFSADSVHEYGNARPALAFLSAWKSNREVADVEAIAVKMISQYVAQLKGLRTGETVTITSSPDMDGSDYVSSVAAHKPYRFYINAQSCPDGSYLGSGWPKWYLDFLRANMKTPKRK